MDFLARPDPELLSPEGGPMPNLLERARIQRWFELTQLPWHQLCGGHGVYTRTGVSAGPCLVMLCDPAMQCHDDWGKWPTPPQSPSPQHLVVHRNSNTINPYQQLYQEITSQVTASKTNSKIKKENDPKKTTPHSWTIDQKQSLLEGIAEQIAAGLSTDNRNLKKEAWTTINRKVNTKFSLKLNVEQLKNQKNQLWKLFLDLKFLREQSGFDWDNNNGCVTTDKSVWDELIDAHPRREFGKLKGKLFPLYELCKSIFSGNRATGKTSEANLPIS
ncbi:hypothetical protein PCANC_10509 [Puccinia coronata f. sp. avenae]|uniref:Myb/SANT-like domain-containing protein n=1 Tax=Puccinia coronata f. sp. avenae TaxID=200324 RepID=A0A2N5UX54_9BASI|nr:hypothetical protein PCANC_10509 [Puccinia coronata f. sp. avenae]